MSDSHFFASCYLGWARGETRGEAIEKLVRMFHRDVKHVTSAEQKRGKPGFYLWTCEVQAPIDESYSIKYFQPEGMEIRSGCHHHVTYVTQKKIAYSNENTVADYAVFIGD